jgi:excisionase family DNA binding protein
MSQTLTKPAEPRLLKVSDAAKYCHVHASTIRKWVAQGLLPAIRINGRMMFRRSSIDAALDKLEAVG